MKHMATKNPLKKDLVAAAKELNEVMGLDPEIDVTLNKKDLIEVLREAAELVEEDDELTDATDEVLEALMDDEDEEETPEPTPEPEPEVEEEPEPEPEDEEETPAPAEKKLTRVQSVVEAIKRAEEPIGRAELAGKANDLYARSGGASNLSEAKWSVGQVLATLEAWGAVIVDEDGLIRKDA